MSRLDKTSSPNQYHLYFDTMRNLTLAYNKLSQYGLVCKVVASAEEIFGKCGFVIQVDESLLDNCKQLIDTEFVIKQSF
ncbi:MAG: hypothetical protein FWE37_00775 [Spirochaetaceae bacterium]|nr:hypothetical protein [Spirochaetaceae bacterium]